MSKPGQLPSVYLTRDSSSFRASNQQSSTHQSIQPNVVYNVVRTQWTNVFFIG